MARRGNAPAASQQSVRPGEMFNLPGVTRWTEQFDLNDSTTQALAGGSSTPFTGLLPFRTTDIVFCWFWGLTINQSVTTGGTGISLSQYFPFNFVQQFQLLVSNLYDVIDVQSGIDLALFNTIRPYRMQNVGNVEYTSPAVWPYAPETTVQPSSPANTASAFGTPYVQTSTGMLIKYQVPIALWFDEYFELDRDGSILAVANRIPVSPFYMSGTARNVTPTIVGALVNGSNNDAGPGNLGSTGVFTSASMVSRWRRSAMYGTKVPQEMPVVWNWRYALVSRRFFLGAVSLIDIPLKSVVNNGGGGQILSVFFRFFDPTANAAIDLNTIKEGKLLYGSGLIRFDDLPDQNMQRFYEQHNIRLPVGIWVWDLAQDENGRITNARTLNLYTTDVTVHFDFTGTLSTTAYVVVGVEYLAYVIDEPTIV